MRALGTWFVLLVIAGLFTGGALAAEEGNWPNKPIELYVGFPPGGPSDTVARLYAAKLAQELGVPVAVMNKPGGGGALCAEYVARAKPDGYTISEAAYSIISQRPHTHHTAYTSQDFTFILSHSDYNYAFVVKKDAPWKSFKEWVDFARRNPGTRYGTYGAFGSTHLTMEWIVRREGIKVPHVPFKGDGEGLPALLGGHIDIFGGAGMHPALIAAGKLRTLLQLSGESADPVKVPYLQEAYPDFPKNLMCFVNMPRGLIGPKGIPSPIVQKLANALKKSLDGDDLKKFMKEYRHRIVIWDSETSYKNVQNASESTKNFLQEIGFVKK